VLNLFTALQTLAFTTADRLKSEEKGASAVEYAILIGLIAAAVVAAATAFRPMLVGLFQNINVDGQ
jgi:pilus assembly protein Flp/PilA